MNFVFLPKCGSINSQIDSLVKVAIRECRTVLLIQKLPDPQFRIQTTDRQSQYFYEQVLSWDYPASTMSHSLIELCPLRWYYCR